MIEAAARRQESRGAHYRIDFPHADSEHWNSHITFHREEHGK